MSTNCTYIRALQYRKCPKKVTRAARRSGSRRVQGTYETLVLGWYSGLKNGVLATAAVLRAESSVACGTVLQVLKGYKGIVVDTRNVVPSHFGLDLWKA
jgi:hypothetical protein